MGRIDFTKFGAFSDTRFPTQKKRARFLCVREATGVDIRRPVFYSAEYGFGVRDVFDLIVEQMPLERRPVA